MPDDANSEAGDYKTAQADAKAAKARAKALRPWYKKKRYIFGGLLGAFVVIGVAGSAGSSDSTNSTNNTSSTSASTSSSGATKTGTTPIPGVGETIRLSRDGWAITVTKVGRAQTLKGIFENKQALGVYLIVDITMENITNTPQSLGGDRFRVYDDKNREYKYYLEGTVSNDQQELGSKIGPGLKAPGTIVFDVPPDATGLQLETVGKGRIRLD